MRNRWFGFGLAVLAAVASVLVFDRLPPEVTTHWNFRGQPDGWSSRTTAALFGPLAILGLTVIVWVLPIIDPKRENYPKFAAVFGLLVNVLIVFLLVVHLALLANGAGAPVDMMRVLGVSIGVMLVVAGNYLGRLRPNWFVGIRTPWTLSSEEVWRKTHRIGGWLFVAAGLITLLVVWIPGTRALYTGFIATMVAAAGSAGLSLIFWMQEKKGRRGT